MTIELFGADCQRYPFEIGELSQINRADMRVIDHREELTVQYKDGSYTVYTTDTTDGYYVGGYPVYDSSTGFSMLNCKQWLNDKSAWDRMI